MKENNTKFLIQALTRMALILLIATGAARPGSAFWPFDTGEEKQSEEFSAPTASLPTPEQKREESLKIDTILSTLNESLEENKKLRTDAENAQEQLNRSSIENNVLRSQLRTLQAEADSYKTELTKHAEETKKNIQKLEQEVGRLQIEAKKAEEMKEFAEESMAYTEAENQKVRKLLEQSILESERDTYVKLISESEIKANRAAEKLMTAKRQNERMRSELASAYYNLGNMLAGSAQYRSALTQYKKALKLNPNDAWTHYNSAIIYDYYLNNKEKSLAHYKKYLSLEPAEKEINKVRERVLEMELLNPVTPGQPLKSDFDKYQKDLNKPYVIKANG